MGRSKKPSKTIALNLDEHVAAAVAAYAKHRKISRTRAIELLVSLSLRSEQGPSVLDGETALVKLKRRITASTPGSEPTE